MIAIRTEGKKKKKIIIIISDTSDERREERHHICVKTKAVSCNEAGELSQADYCNECTERGKKKKQKVKENKYKQKTALFLHERKTTAAF